MLLKLGCGGDKGKTNSDAYFVILRSKFNFSWAEIIQIRQIIMTDKRGVM